jgi:hypothetical protein
MVAPFRQPDTSRQPDTTRHTRRQAGMSRIVKLRRDTTRIESTRSRRKSAE